MEYRTFLLFYYSIFYFYLLLEDSSVLFTLGFYAIHPDMQHIPDTSVNVNRKLTILCLVERVGRNLWSFCQGHLYK